MTIGVTDDSGCGGTRDYTFDVHPCAFAVSEVQSTRPWGAGIIFVANACGVDGDADVPWITVMRHAGRRASRRRPTRDRDRAARSSSDRA